MSKLDQVLVLEPATELKFRGPFTEVVSSELKLHNPSPRRVLFKVKTTAPKRYCVRPNSGLIEPNSNVAVAVMLQPFDHDPNEKNKHKFMVQSMFAPDGPIASQDQLWKEATPAQLMDSKLKCVFETSPDSAQNNLDNSTNKRIEELKPTSYVKEVYTGSETPKVSNIESELRKVHEECQTLRTEKQRLENENNWLKGESVKLRKVAMSDTTSSSVMSHTVGSKGAGGGANILSSIPPAVYFVVMVILGLIIGKFVL